MKSRLWALLFYFICILLCGCNVEERMNVGSDKYHNKNVKTNHTFSNTKTKRVLQFENEYVRVWRTIIMPNQPLKYHRHDGARIVVGLTGGTLKKILQDGTESDLTFDKGVPYWMDADPPKELHGDINRTKHPIEVLVIEFKSIKTATG